MDKEQKKLPKHREASAFFITKKEIVSKKEEKEIWNGYWGGAAAIAGFVAGAAGLACVAVCKISQCQLD